MTDYRLNQIIENTEEAISKSLAMNGQTLFSTTSDTNSEPIMMNPHEFIPGRCRHTVSQLTELLQNVRDDALRHEINNQIKHYEDVAKVYEGTI